MNGIIQMLIQQAMSGQLQNHPLMGTFNKMMQGKSPEQQFETLLNIAKSKGIDVNKKQYSAEDLRQMGFKI